ncbi:MAG: hypothetical protein LBH78_03370 [Rickettsiales bacterium]|jgi:hypothetical protein|nr:hypothetical protein [Rickettsiales bacterium]
MRNKIVNGLKTGLNIFGFTATLILFGILVWYIIKIPEIMLLIQKTYKGSESVESAIFPIRAILSVFATGLLSATVSCLLSLCSKK